MLYSLCTWQRPPHQRCHGAWVPQESLLRALVLSHRGQDLEQVEAGAIRLAAGVECKAQRVIPTAVPVEVCAVHPEWACGSREAEGGSGRVVEVGSALDAMRGCTHVHEHQVSREEGITDSWFNRTVRTSIAFAAGNVMQIPMLYVWSAEPGILSGQPVARQMLRCIQGLVCARTFSPAPPARPMCQAQSGCAGGRRPCGRDTRPAVQLS